MNAVAQGPPSLADFTELTADLLEEEIALQEAKLSPARRSYNKAVREWKRAQPLMTFRLRQGAGHHVQTDPDSIERFYRASENKPILSALNLSEQWPEKFERIDGFASDQNPFLNVPAPGELPEEFQRRMERLKAQNAVQSAVNQATQAGIPQSAVLDPFMGAGVEVGIKPHPQTGQVTHANPVASQTAPEGHGSVLDPIHLTPASQAAIAQQPPTNFPQRSGTGGTDLEKMTVAQLKKFAEDNEVTISPNLNDKAKLVIEIRRGMDRK